MRRKHKDFKKLIGYSMTMGGASLISGGLPAVAKPPVQAVVKAGSPFVAPMVAVTSASIAIKELEKLNSNKPKRRYKK